MRHGYIKTAAATPYITVADCRANGEEIIRLIREMEKEHTKVMVFPELCITGYTCQDLFLQRRLLDSAWETLMRIAAATADVDALIFLGVPVRNKMQQLCLTEGKFWDWYPSHICRIMESFMSRDISYQDWDAWSL